MLHIAIQTPDLQSRSRRAIGRRSSLAPTWTSEVSTCWLIPKETELNDDVTAKKDQRKTDLHVLLHDCPWWLVMLVPRIKQKHILSYSKKWRAPFCNACSTSRINAAQGRRSSQSSYGGWRGGPQQAAQLGKGLAPHWNCAVQSHYLVSLLITNSPTQACLLGPLTTQVALPSWRAA